MPVEGGEEIMGDNTEANFENQEATEEQATTQQQAEVERLARNGIPDYATADDETRAVLDSLIAQIDINDIETVRGFGKDYLMQLSSVADQIREEASAENNDVTESLENIEGALQSLNIAELPNTIMKKGAGAFNWVKQNPGTALATGAMVVIGGPIAGGLGLIGLPALKNRINHMKNKGSSEDIADTLRKTVAQSEEIILALQSAEAKIPGAIQRINTLGRTRAEVSLQIALHIGAAIEKLRQVDEDVIPGYQQQAQTNPDAEAYLMDVMSNRDALSQRVNDMIAGRAVGYAAGMTLARLKSMFNMAASKISTHQSVSIPQWKMQMAEAGVLITAARVTKAINEADKFGDKLLTQSSSVANKTVTQMIESSKRGTYDVAKVAAAMTGIATSLQMDMKAIASRKDDLERDRSTLLIASTKFRDQINSLSEQANAHMRLAAPESKMPRLSPPTPVQATEGQEQPPKRKPRKSTTAAPTAQP